MLWIRARAKQAKARIYIAKVEELSLHFSNMQGVKLMGSTIGMSYSEHLKSPDVHYDESVFVGRKYNADRLTAYLTDSDFLRVIYIFGDEGIGKTALFRSMYNGPDMERDFRCRAWISNYITPNLESVLLEILKQSPVMTLKDLELKETDKLCAFLHKILMEPRYLTVLDDLKSAEILDNLLVLVGQLDPENSRKLLSGHSSISDEGLIDKISGKGSGSPPKVLLFGGRSSAFKNSDPGLFPYGMGLQPLGGLVAARCQVSKLQLPSFLGLVRWDGHFTAEACFQELANRNLVQVVRRREMDRGPKTCGVSGYLHDHFSEFASKFGHISDLQSANQEKSGIRLREVEQLLKVPTANRDSSLLRVLDLEDVYKPKLPKQFGYLLPNLRYLFGQPSYLNLSDDMKDMQSISKMYLLGSLDEEGLSCLPKRLRVLTLSLSEMDLVPMDYLRAVSDLVTLMLFGNSYIGKYMVFGKGTFSCLRVLKLLDARELGGGLPPRRDDVHTARVGH
ncbi:hypothetical protein MLD38_037614 [Melastoma candidum]|uniref:Uncharacterized protein n=1 Tax=Melastoma candidum TaxID=119954 RepID=A0ACB9LNL0_9MYRT|nr:hypothetical protein MLD38_037614 [Melastoma candidum]